MDYAKIRPIIMIVIVLSVKNSLQRVEFYEEENATARSRLIDEVLRPYLINFDPTWKVLIYARNLYLLERLSPTIPLILIDNWDILTGGMTERNTAGSLIVILDGNAADKKLHSDFEKLQGVRTRQTVLLICYGSTNCGSEFYFKGIVGSANSSPVLYYVVVMDEGESPIKIYERTKTAEGNCGVSRLVRLPYHSLDAWLKDGMVSVSDNFNKCPIRLATWYVPSRSRPCKPQDSNHFCGLEGEIVKNVVDKINATPVTTVMNNGEEATDLVATERADLGYGHLYVNTNETFVHSKWYVYIVATIVVPHSASGSGASLLTMALPLSSKVWIGFAVAIASMLILGRLIPYFRRLSALQQFGIIIGIAVSFKPQRISQRIYFFCIVLFGFLFAQIYLVNLTKIYSSVPRQHIIKTFEELEASGLRIHGNEGGKKMLNKFGYTRIAENNYKVLDMNEHVAKYIETLTGQSSDPIYVEIKLDTLSSWKNVEYMGQMRRLFSLGVITPNSSSLMTVIDKVIMGILESGIQEKESVSKLTGNDALTYAWLRGMGSLKSNKTCEPWLGLKDLQGVFMLLGGGLSSGIISFIGEIAVGLFGVKLAPWKRTRSVR